jgi:predicted acylesterase/phospholipase RssA
MLSRVVGMLSKSYDKSAPEVCCTSEGARDPAVSSDHTVASSQASEPGPRLSEKTSKDGNLFKVTKKSFAIRLPSRILSLCGGGHLCIAHVGVLKALRHSDQLKYIKGVVGISAGALVGLIYVLGYTIDQIERLLQGIDLSIFTSVESESALFFYQTMCINSGQKLDSFLVSLLEAKGLSSNLTFAELKSPIFFRCYATHIQTSEIQEFSIEKTPNHSILFAVRASMCLPVIFAPMKDPFTDALYYDAALIHNMPFVFLSEEEKRQTLSVFFDVFGQSTEEAHNSHDITSVFKYAIKSFYSQRNGYFLKRYVENMIHIPVDATKFLHSSSKDVADCIALGYSKCINFLKARPTSCPARRYSVT